MSGQALAIYDVAPVIHSHRVKYVLCDIDPEDVYLLLHGTRLLWLHGCTALELIVAHCSRSAQGRVHFITTSGYRLEVDVCILERNHSLRSGKMPFSSTIPSIIAPVSPL